MAGKPQIKVAVSEQTILTLCYRQGFDLEGLAIKTGYNYLYLKKVIHEGEITYTMAIYIGNALKVPNIDELKRLTIKPTRMELMRINAANTKARRKRG